MTATCTTPPTITDVGDFLLIECAACDTEATR